MRSKISFFNNTIFWKNVTHFWPIWAIYSVICFWRMPVNSYFNIKSVTQMTGITAAERDYMKVMRVLEGMNLSLNTMIIFLFAIISSVAVFSYLYTSKNANMIHALPVRREELFVTNYFSGLLYLIVPQFISFLLTVFIWFGNGINHLEYLLQWLGIVIGETVFAYSFGVFCVMLTGNIVAAPIYFLLLNYLYKGIWSVVNLVLQSLVYGYKGNEIISCGAALVPLEYFTDKIRIFYPMEQDLTLPYIEGMECLKWYFLAAVVLTILGMVMYRKRQLECAGDFIAISWMRPVFRWIGAFICAGLCANLVQITFSEKTLSGESFPVLLICWLAGGCISFFGIEMIIEKRFMVFHKKRWAESGFFLSVIILSLACLEWDVFHLEDRIPEAEKVSAVYMHGTYGRYITGKGRIQESIDLHKKVVASKKKYQEYFKKYHGEECNYITLNMIYFMEGGGKQKWTYSIPSDAYYLNEKGGAVEDLIQQEINPHDYMVSYFSDQYSSIEVQNGSYIDCLDERQNFRSVDISVEAAEKLVEAFKKDVTSGEYRVYPYNTKERLEKTYVNTLNICYTPPEGARILQYGWENEENISEGKYSEYSGIILTTECKNTIALLEEMGIINSEHRLATEKEYNTATKEEIELYQ